MMYKVRWEMDLEAGSAREAAEIALQVHRDTSSIATFFEVAPLDPDDPRPELDFRGIDLANPGGAR